MKQQTAGRSVIVLIAVLAISVVSVVYSHCQIPCGIYDDPARFTSMAENLTTIEKSMNQINTLSQEQKPNYNQIVRWVQNKEDHADELTHTVTYYFLAQRIKPVDKVDAAEYDNYIKKLTLTHAMISYCTKAKQSTDTAAVAQLRTLLDEFKKTYELEHNH